MNFWFRLWAMYQAWRRNEKRIAPAAVRGRVYAARGEKNVLGGGGGSIAAQTKGEAHIYARVYRALENKWYDLGRIS